MKSALELVEISGNLSVDEEAVMRGRLEALEEAEEKEQANDRAIEDRIKVRVRFSFFLHLGQTTTYRSSVVDRCCSCRYEMLCRICMSISIDHLQCILQLPLEDVVQDQNHLH